MGYIDKNLMDGEQIVYRTKLHWIVYLWPIILFVLFPIALSKGQGFALLGPFLLIISIIWAISAFVSRRTSEFGVTNKRVLIKIGFISRDSLETLLTRVEGIEVRQGILGRIFNYGTITIKGTGGTINPFKRIEDPFEFRKIVQEQISRAQS
jgi:uncharacterized membrane protein YdbT with pleckstrin-like domain